MLHRSRIGLACWLCAAMSAVSLAAPGAAYAQQAAPAPKPAGPQPPFEVSGPPRHTGDYPSFNVQWQVDGRVSGVQAVFPHPAVPSRIVLVTESGLSISNDTGKTWKPMEGTSAEKIGQVRHVEFAPDDVDVMYLASATKGIWLLEGDKPPVQIGSTASGLADDSTVQVCFDGGDLRLQTLVAVHGKAAAGLSKSVDGGQTWTVVPGTKDYFITKLLCGGPGMPWAFLSATAKDAASPPCIYSCQTIGDFLREVARDAQGTDGANELIASGKRKDRREVSYWATAGNGLLAAVHGGIDSERVGPDGSLRWSSIGVTWGPTADSRIIYAYEPSKLGMAVSQDDGNTFAAFSRGLQTGLFIKQGAAVRANANGSVFFGVVNGSLYVARRYTGEFSITDVKVDPPMCVFSQSAYEEGMRNLRGRLSEYKGQRNAAGAAGPLVQQVDALKPAMPNTNFAITARVSGPDAPASVTVDLSRVSIMPAKDCRTPLYDDGKHGDGAAGDGVYGATFTVRPERLRNDWREWRRPWPGPMGLTVTAVAKDGSLSSGIGVLTIINRPESFTFLTPRVVKDWPGSEGQVTAALDDAIPPGNIRQSRKSLRIEAKDGQWSLPLPANEVKDVLGYYAIAFYVRGDVSQESDLGVQFRDDVPDTLPRAGNKVLVAKEGLIEDGKGVDGWRRVVIPIERLVAEPADSGSDQRLRPTMVGSILLSGPGAQTLNISDIKCCVSAKEVEAGAAGGR